MEELIFQTSKPEVADRSQLYYIQTSLAGRGFAHVVRGKNRWLPNFAHNKMALSEI